MLSRSFPSGEARSLFTVLSPPISNPIDVLRGLNELEDKKSSMLSFFSLLIFFFPHYVHHFVGNGKQKTTYVITAWLKRKHASEQEAVLSANCNFPLLLQCLSYTIVQSQTCEHASVLSCTHTHPRRCTHSLWVCVWVCVCVCVCVCVRACASAPSFIFYIIQNRVYLSAACMIFIAL